METHRCLVRLLPLHSHTPSPPDCEGVLCTGAHAGQPSRAGTQRCWCASHTFSRGGAAPSACGGWVGWLLCGPASLPTPLHLSLRSVAFRSLTRCAACAFVRAAYTVGGRFSPRWSTPSCTCLGQAEVAAPRFADLCCPAPPPLPLCREGAERDKQESKSYLAELRLVSRVVGGARRDLDIRRRATAVLAGAPHLVWWLAFGVCRAASV